MTSGKQSKAQRNESQDAVRASRQAKIDAAGPKSSKAKPALVGIVVAVIVAALGLAVYFGSRSQAPAPTPTASGTGGPQSGFPVGATGPDGGIVANPTTAKAGAPTLDIYEDFQCPACGQVEQALGSTIKKMADAGEVKVIYHMKNFLDANLNNDSSTRAGNAAACAADAGKFPAYHDAIYANMPAQEGMGYTDAQLEKVAGTAGITGSALTTWKQCVSNKTYVDYVKRVEESTAKAGITGTPAFRVNGKDFKLQDQQVTSAEDFRTKVLAAGAAK